MKTWFITGTSRGSAESGRSPRSERERSGRGYSAQPRISPGRRGALSRQRIGAPARRDGPPGCLCCGPPGL